MEGPAQNATQIENSKAVLEKPCCEIVGSKGQQIKLKSDTGLLNQEKQTFAYEGNVQLETDFPIFLKYTYKNILLTMKCSTVKGNVAE